MNRNGIKANLTKMEFVKKKINRLHIDRVNVNIYTKSNKKEHYKT